MLGAFFLVLAAGTSIYCLGTLLSRYLLARAEDFLIDFALGIAAACWILQWLGLAGGLGYLPHPATLVLFTAPVLAYLFTRPARAAGVLTLGKEWALPAGMMFLSYFALTWTLDSMPDPLYYHLTAARLWVEAGRAYLPPNNVSVLLSGAWDSLYVYAASLLGGPQGGGLIAQQLAGQWMQFLLAGVGTVACLARFWRFVFPRLGSGPRVLLALVACVTASQLSTVYLAKNDWGANLFSLLGVLLFLEGKSLRDIFAAGFFAALALTTKISAGFALGPLLLFAVLIRKASFRAWWAYAAGFVAAVAPYCYRNYRWTEDLYYPLFRGKMAERLKSPSWDIDLFTGHGFSLAGKEFLARQFLLESLFWPLTVIAAFFFFWRRSRNRASALSLLMTVAALAYFLKVGIRAEVRIFGLGNLLLAGLGLGCLLQWLVDNRWWPGGSWRGAANGFALWLMAALYVQFPFFAPRIALAQASPPEEIRTHFGGNVLAWVRLNLPEGKTVASANENRLYYLSTRRPFRIWDSPALDRALYEAKTLLEAVSAIRNAGVDYLIFTRMDWDVSFRRAVHDFLDRALARHPEVVTYGTRNSVLIDLSRLEDRLRAQNPL
jgi:hypothetical protein